METIRRYGAALRVVTVTHEDGHLAGIGVLTLPAWAMGETACHVAVLGTDGTVPGQSLIDRVLDEARRLGAEVVYADMHRLDKLVPRIMHRTAAHYKAKIHSVKLRWSLREE